MRTRVKMFHESCLLLENVSDELLIIIIIIYLFFFLRRRFAGRYNMHWLQIQVEQRFFFIIIIYMFSLEAFVPGRLMYKE